MNGLRLPDFATGDDIASLNFRRVQNDIDGSTDDLGTELIH